MALAGCGLAELLHAVRTPSSILHDMYRVPPAPCGPVAWAGMGADELRGRHPPGGG